MIYKYTYTTTMICIRKSSSLSDEYQAIELPIPESVGVTGLLSSSSELSITSLSSLLLELECCSEGDSRLCLRPGLQRCMSLEKRDLDDIVEPISLVSSFGVVTSCGVGGGVMEICGCRLFVSSL